jgi:hypothetical protein
MMLNPFDDRSLIESVYYSFKQRTEASFNTITATLLNRNERFRGSMLCWELSIKLLIPYYNNLKR